MKLHTSPHNFRTLLVAGLAVAGSLLTVPAFAATDVVTSLPELGAIAKAVGGNKVTVTSIARPGRDYHAIESRPSDVARVKNCDLMVRTGMGLDFWMDALVNASGNKAFSKGGQRSVDASEKIPRLDVPKGSATGASGDVHPTGNPHFYYDPIYAKFVARNIVTGLIRVDESNADAYRANYKSFNAEIDKRMEGWKKELSPYAGHNVVTYHENYAYFLRRFALVEYNHMEPKPGIPPSAAHVNELLKMMKRDKVKAVVIESIYPTKYPDLLSRELGVKYVVASYSVPSVDEDGYYKLIDGLVDSFKKALSQ